MTIKAVTHPYEILIRFTDGRPSGYHYKTIEIVADGDRVFSSTESPPLPLEGEAVEAVLGQALQSALARITVLESQLSESAVE